MLTARCLRSILTAKIPGHIAPLFSSCGRFGENRKTRDGHLFFILLKSNYSISRLRPGNSVHLQRLAKLLICSLLFFDVFSKAAVSPLLYPPQPPPAGCSPNFSFNFSPKTPNPTRFLDYSPFHSSFFPKPRLCPRKKSLIITKHFLDFKIIYGIIPA